jgi:hypothetical protein
MLHALLALPVLLPLPLLASSASRCALELLPLPLLMLRCRLATPLLNCICSGGAGPLLLFGAGGSAGGPEKQLPTCDRPSSTAKPSVPAAAAAAAAAALVILMVLAGTFM